jgi:drug/metabolite transporter (DMT)-like permease
MSVIEPIFAMEVPTVAIFSLFILHERLSMQQTMLMIFLIAGIFLVATKSFSHLKNIHVEKGVWQAILATFGMGMTNFLFGVSARAISPLMINWFTSLFMAIVCLVYLLKTKRAREIIDYWKSEKGLILGVSISDNIAWVTYAYSTLYIPIAIATGISESYIALAAGLGLYFNKEKLSRHQWIGLVITIVSAIVLAVITES